MVKRGELWVISTLRSNNSIPDHHFDRIYPDAEPPALGDYIRDASAAVSELSVKVHPLSRGRLGHDVDVNLQGMTQRSFQHHTLSDSVWPQWHRWRLCYITLLFYLGHSWTSSSPSLQWGWPCLEDRTWNVPSPSGLRPQWTQRHWCGGWPSHSDTEGEETGNQFIVLLASVINLIHSKINLVSDFLLPL